jgi:hypothetical protein
VAGCGIRVHPQVQRVKRQIRVIYMRGRMDNISEELFCKNFLKDVTVIGLYRIKFRKVKGYVSALPELE